MVLGYERSLANKLEFGISIPYRYTDISDDVNSESHYAALVVYIKKTDNGMEKNKGRDGVGRRYVRIRLLPSIRYF